jgi:SAM-dependent methyltransferase
VTPDRDRWLERWLPLLLERSAGESVLELGCGRGHDSSVLAAAGLSVIGVDRSATELAAARYAVPSATFHERDLRAPFPIPAPLGVIVASLCLHYFDWPSTVELARRLGDALREGGVLLLRVNSTHDHEHGASGHPRLDDDFYLVEGQPKRFFDRRALEALFHEGWQALHLEERIIHRYARPKAIWEAAFERRGSASGQGASSAADATRERKARMK